MSTDQPAKPGSLQPDVLRQAWHCESCGERGTVEYSNNEGAFSVLMRITADHAAKNPVCPDGKKIRVPPND
jgi:hypothetical protein